MFDLDVGCEFTEDRGAWPEETRSCLGIIILTALLLVIAIGHVNLEHAQPSVLIISTPHSILGKSL
jgi:hypothetical protein